MHYLLIVALITGIDQLTKYFVVRELGLYESVEIIPGLFNLTYITNRGAAFSLLAEVDSPWRHYFFLFVGGCAVIALTILWFYTVRESAVQALGIALISAGALGNLLDRIRTGAVVDFLDFYFGRYHWPAFNVADSAICLGVAVVLILTMQSKRKD